MLKIPAKLLCAWRASSPAIAAEASVTVLKLLSSISLKRTSTAFYPTTRRMLGRLFLMNARIMAKVEVTSR
uniref:KikA protein n=2 Tax=root TaxID=1 RepID=Q79CR9_ECOLX|nr:ORF70; putative KikA protein [Escherichia coli]AAC60408.1 ORF70 [IncN plasmid pCU1]prf//2124362A ORF [Klebsiella oxytoca]